jgi:hypothetical protein
LPIKHPLTFIVLYIRYFKESASDKAVGLGGPGVVGVEAVFLQEKTIEPKTAIKRNTDRFFKVIFFIYIVFKVSITKYGIMKIMVLFFTICYYTKIDNKSVWSTTISVLKLHFMKKGLVFAVNK